MLLFSNAIVLNKISYSDTSLIFRVFTQDYGKITILAKGVLRPKNIIGPLIEPANHLYIQYYNKSNRDIQILKDASFVDQYPHIRKRLSGIILSLAIVEIIDKVTLASSPYPILYKLCWRTLEKLNDSKQNIWLIFVFYLYQLLIRLGFMPDLDKCNKCFSQLFNANIDSYTGEVLCIKCINNCQINLEGSSFQLLKKISTLHLDDLININFQNDDIFNIILFLDLFSSIHIEGLNRVKAMKMVRNLINEQKLKFNI